MADTKLFDSSYDDARNWIKKHRRNGDSWERIDYACKDTSEKLDEFLQRQIEECLWPQDITPVVWHELVHEMKESSDKRKALSEASGAGQLNDSTPDKPFAVPEDDESCWILYRNHLKEDNHFDDLSIDNIEDSCSDILRRLSRDTQESGPIKGLVIGNVQSGKTANMAGLMAMAADNGFNMFIVLSGTIENLRKQTQERLYSDLHRPGGLDWVQLGHLSKNPAMSSERLSSLELGLKDRHRYLKVCLKNKKRLNDLLDWLHSDIQKTAQLKILLIDDEADQASIDTGDVYDESERRAINKAIINIVNCWDRNATNSKNNRFKGHYCAMNYISYTATPYANCLNDTRDFSLYPRNFIKTLPVSPQYIGPVQIFGSMDADMKTLDIVREVSDDDFEKISKIHDDQSKELPESLEDAILWFFCAASVMRHYNYRKPVSMLIHTSQKQAEHQCMADAITEWFRQNKSHLIAKCRRVYKEETSCFRKEDFLEVCSNYGDAAAEIWEYPQFSEIEDEIRVLTEDITSIRMEDDGDLTYTKHIHLCIDNCANNKVNEDGEHFRLSYPDPHSPNCPDFSTAFIVIGGNTLSRGLTLEGLVSTYFLRTVKQADTLMQMGRWFGYRKHYELLPRIWMTRDTEQKFALLADIDSDLRNTIYTMSLDENATPLDYQPVIRTSPKMTWMKLTSPNKAQMAVETELDYSGIDSQLTVYSTDSDFNRNNLKLTDKFLEGLGESRPAEFSYGLVWENIPFSRIYDEFLSRFQVYRTSTVFQDMKGLKEWVDKMTGENILGGWDVSALGTRLKQSDNEDVIWNISGKNIGKIKRTAKIRKDDRLNIGVLSGKMEYLSDLHKDRMPEKDLEDIKDNEKLNTEYQKFRKDCGAGKTPLLLIYRIDKKSAPDPAKSKNRKSLNVSEDLVGISMVIPGTKTGKHYVKARICQIRETDPESETADGH